MQNEVQDQVCSTFMEVVEKLTFMFGEVIAKDEVDAIGTPYTLASMSFGGDVKGLLSVAVPTGLTAEIAANFLVMYVVLTTPQSTDTDPCCAILFVH